MIETRTTIRLAGTIEEDRIVKGTPGIGTALTLFKVTAQDSRWAAV